MRCRFAMTTLLLVLVTLAGSCTTPSKMPYKHYKTSIIRFLGSIDKNTTDIKGLVLMHITHRKTKWTWQYVTQFTGGFAQEGEEI